MPFPHAPRSYVRTHYEKVIFRFYRGCAHGPLRPVAVPPASVSRNLPVSTTRSTYCTWFCVRRVRWHYERPIACLACLSCNAQGDPRLRSVLPPPRVQRRSSSVPIGTPTIATLPSSVIQTSILSRSETCSAGTHPFGGNARVVAGLMAMPTPSNSRRTRGGPDHACCDAHKVQDNIVHVLFSE